MTQSPSNNDVCDYWGYTFRWTDLHTSPEQLRPMIFTFDKLSDECLERLEEISPQSARPAKHDDKGPKRDLYSLLKEHAKADPKLDQLWTEINTVPDWVDWEQIKRGQEVFFRYGLPILNVVGILRNLVVYNTTNPL